MNIQEAPTKVEIIGVVTDAEGNVIRDNPEPKAEIITKTRPLGKPVTLSRHAGPNRAQRRLLEKRRRNAR